VIPHLTLLDRSLEDLHTEIVEGARDDLRHAVNCVVTSPPYKDKDGYSVGMVRALAGVLDHVLAPGGRVFLNFGQLRGAFDRPYETALHLADAAALQFGQTIAWVKSIAINGTQSGHYQPINSDKVLNYCWEPIFMLYKDPEPALDRLALGVPFSDKSNLARGTRGSNGDLHCAGDVWFVPYPTTGATSKKQHRHEYPEEVVERCIRVAGLSPTDVVMDPFSGSGTTVCVAKRLGYSAIALDRDNVALATTRMRWKAQPVA
jgi:site-specific DNA-methyltransferase (adenine-specific)